MVDNLHAEIRTDFPIQIITRTAPVNVREGRAEIRLGQQDNRAGDANAHTQQTGRAGIPWPDEPADEVNSNITPYRNRQRHHQVRRHKIPAVDSKNGMRCGNNLSKLRQMTHRQAEHPDQKNQQQPVVPIPGAPRAPPDQQQVGADLQRHQQFKVKELRLQDCPEVADDAVSFRLILPTELRPGLLGDAAHRHNAAESQPVIDEVDQYARARADYGSQCTKRGKSSPHCPSPGRSARPFLP